MVSPGWPSDLASEHLACQILREYDRPLACIYMRLPEINQEKCILVEAGVEPLTSSFQRLKACLATTGPIVLVVIILQNNKQIFKKPHISIQRAKFEQANGRVRTGHLLPLSVGKSPRLLPTDVCPLL